MSRIIIVALAYVMVYVLEWLDPPIAEYYFYAAVSSFLLILLCVWTKDLINLGYAITQLICMYLYLCKISPDAPWVNWVLYDPMLNVATWVYYYEFIMVLTGLINVVFLLIGYINTASSRGKINSQGNNIPLQKVSV